MAMAPISGFKRRHAYYDNEDLNKLINRVAPVRTRA